MRENYIFINIASYRDPELIPTIEDAIDKVNERNKIENEINMLSSGDVIKRLRKRWRRDA